MSFELILTALVDKTGKAVLSRQVKPGKYTAIARVVIGPYVVWSNIVPYIVE